MTTLTAVYDALIAGDIPSEKATAAVEAIEVARDEPWKRKTEAAHANLRTEVKEGFADIRARINTTGGVIISLQVGQILLVLGWIALSS